MAKKEEKKQKDESGVKVEEEKKVEGAVSSKKTQAKEPKKNAPKKLKPKKRSRLYEKIYTDFDKNKKYSLDDAIELAQKKSYSKFDGTVTLDIRINKLKGDESVRGIVKLPHAVAKKMEIALTSEELIEKIKKGIVDFDILLATSEQMPELAKVAKILGPRGLMPNPKDGTVVDDPKKAKEELAQMARYRADAHYNIHVAIGKTSWDKKKLAENVNAVLKALAKYKKNTVVLSPTMGPGVRVDV